jgi:HTH-type transcriptional regulator, quorum sensing regulator NprR
MKIIYVNIIIKVMAWLINKFNLGENEMIFLTTGEKIRNLRKKYNMRQQELEDENITRAFISMIETGKRGLSKETAKLIATKINEKADNLGTPLNIDEDYLMRTPAEDAQVYCLQKLNNEPTHDEIDVIIDIAIKYELEQVEAQAYGIIGEYEFKSENYTKAFINYMISLDIYKNTDIKEHIAYIYNRLGLCKARQFEYIEAISFFGRACYYSTLTNDESNEKQGLYNIARSYKKLENYDKALEFVDIYIEKCDKDKEFNEYIYASLLKAKCYSLKKNKDKALLVYNKLLEQFSNQEDELLWFVYKNMGDIYLDENNAEKSLEFFNKAEYVAEINDKKKLSITCLQKARLFIKTGALEEAVRFANRGLKISMERNDFEAIIEAHYRLIDIYTLKKDFPSLKMSYIKLIDIFKNNEKYKDDIVKIYSRLALLYLEQNDIEMCKKYLNMAS